MSPEASDSPSSVDNPHGWCRACHTRKQGFRIARSAFFEEDRSNAQLLFLKRQGTPDFENTTSRRIRKSWACRITSNYIGSQLLVSKTQPTVCSVAIQTSYLAALTPPPVTSIEEYRDFLPRDVLWLLPWIQVEAVASNGDTALFFL